MRFVLLTIMAVAIALGAGGWSAAWMLERTEAADTLIVGPWHADRSAGSPDADPYSKARLARSGDLTLGLGEGVAFEARVDTAGRELRRECTYRLVGAYPPARIATLAAFDLEGRALTPREGRPERLVSLNWMRDDENRATISVGAGAEPGNWLAVEGRGRFVLALTFYDTPISTDSGAAPIAMPYIERSGCLIDG